MTCDDYQIAFDQQSVAAASAVATAELDAHLAGCAACTGYVSLSRKLSSMMTTTIASAPPPLDLDAMRAKIGNYVAKTRGYARVRPLFLVLVFLAIVVGVELGTGRPPVVPLVRSAILASFLMVMYYWSKRRGDAYLQELAALQDRGASALVDGYRAHLDRLLRVRALAILQIPISGALVYLAILEGKSVQVTLGALVGVTGVISAFQYFRLRRERAVLD